jgi:hypothetical protein
MLTLLTGSLQNAIPWLSLAFNITKRTTIRRRFSVYFEMQFLAMPTHSIRVDVHILWHVLYLSGAFKSVQSRKKRIRNESRSAIIIHVTGTLAIMTHLTNLHLQNIEHGNTIKKKGKDEVEYLKIESIIHTQARMQHKHSASINASNHIRSSSLKEIQTNDLFNRQLFNSQLLRYVPAWHYLFKRIWKKW